MKPDKTTITKNADCKPGSCLQCSHCSEMNYEEIRSAVPELKRSSDLYAAEAQHYYFYFAQSADRVSR